MKSIAGDGANLVVAQITTIETIRVENRQENIRIKFNVGQVNEDESDKYTYIRLSFL